MAESSAATSTSAAATAEGAAVAAESAGESRVGIVRRSFLKGLGLGVGGLALGLFDVRARAASLPNGGGLTANVFIHVATDGTVSIVCHRSEMGQGVRSSVPVVMADELGADLRRVKVVQGDGNKAYGDQNTDGSTSIRSFYDDLRRAGAVARTMLIAAAAKRWRVAPGSCSAHDHAVFHVPTRRSLGFGALADEAAKLPVPDPKTVTLRPVSELVHVGKPLPYIDGQPIVTGQAQFGADVRLPNMLIAVVAHPPVVGGKVAHYDARRTLAIPGVKKVVELPVPKGPPYAFQPLGGIAVVAENTWAALRGRAALEITWDHGANASYDSSRYREELTASVRAPGQVARHLGDVDGALASAKRRLEAEYHVPHLAHAAMEPLAALAHITTEQGSEHCEVWAPTQNPQDAITEVARALGWKESQVTCHVTFLGGAFGRKSKPDFVAEAALLARALGVPVRVQWSRTDDLHHDYYHTVSAQHLEAALDEDGRITGWLHRTAFPSIGSTFQPNVTHASAGELGQGVLDVPLSIPNLRVENGAATAHVRIGWLRSVNNIHHAFAISSFLDELAHARGRDPREALLEVYGGAPITTPAGLGVEQYRNYGAPLDKHPVDPGRLRRVIERVTEVANWSGRQQAGRALGLAAHRSFLTYVAVVASVIKDAGGKLRVDEAWIAADAGLVVNPERVRNQLEGAVIFGMSLALRSAITMRNGAVEQDNFDAYRLMRINEAPRRIHVELVPSAAPPGGIGEPGVPPVAPAIANAVFALTGIRVRELPLARAGLV